MEDQYPRDIDRPELNPEWGNKRVLSERDLCFRSPIMEPSSHHKPTLETGTAKGAFRPFRKKLFSECYSRRCPSLSEKGIGEVDQTSLRVRV